MEVNTMRNQDVITIDRHLENIPREVRPIVEAALQSVRSVAPDSAEVTYQSSRPRSSSAMWKLVHYRVGGAYVAGIGTFTKHSSLFFYRGRELDDPDGLLEGSGKDTRFVTLRTPADAKAAAVQLLLRQAFELARQGA
jgi:Domain of unknown function (DU1801)